MGRKKKDELSPRPAIDLDIHINEFGEIMHGFDIDKINEFLNQNTKDWRIKAENENESSFFDEEE
ncbi:MAG: hypothetical protein IT216_03940 [Saprospiraceae bacterium]|nr:MAG: hypothetical protein UZ08_BCD001002122 [Candidatus Parvibacillus calidus]MBK7739582.1 hypothetical protein [Candidatus Parvibacillus calidus]MCC7148357.1 hypothetical protein [Saprospiraceae bacterium]WKZ62828.1 MAG: hypothetical protein QY315_13765 [Saprospiraceae bacterium]